MHFFTFAQVVYDCGFLPELLYWFCSPTYLYLCSKLYLQSWWLFCSRNCTKLFYHTGFFLPKPTRKTKKELTLENKWCFGDVAGLYMMPRHMQHNIPAVSPSRRRPCNGDGRCSWRPASLPRGSSWERVPNWRSMSEEFHGHRGTSNGEPLWKNTWVQT